MCLKRRYLGLNGGMLLQAEGAKWMGITFWSACHSLQVLCFMVLVEGIVRWREPNLKKRAIVMRKN